jgi:K+-sensing histidine kinase KdpD
MNRVRVQETLAWVGALAGPVLLTALLVWIGGLQRDYVFLYLGLVAILGLARGIWPALVAAALSFLLVDFFFVPPIYRLTIADQQDITNVLAFAATAGIVGLLTSMRRRALLSAEALTRQLRQANSQLVRLNKEQAEAAQAELRLARSQEQITALRAADRLRRDLLANISHELRTPLGTILTESTGALPDNDGLEASRRLGTIAAEARRLSELVDDMLDMSVIESGTLELHLEPLRVGDAIEAATERLHRSSPRRGLEWDAGQGDVEVLADWDRLGQILDNLLANADRFGPPGTPIGITVACEEPGLVTIRVSDRGAGVPAELRPRLFERFVRGQPAVPGQQPAGTGLGLSIVKGLVEAHAGTIRLEEKDGETGATFAFTLPEAPPATTGAGGG